MDGQTLLGGFLESGGAAFLVACLVIGTQVERAGAQTSPGTNVMFAYVSRCGCYFQKSLNLSSGDISVYRGAGSRPQRLDTTPTNAPPTTATSKSSMVTRLRSSSMIHSSTDGVLRDASIAG
jgi:hypothetical protein